MAKTLESAESLKAIAAQAVARAGTAASGVGKMTALADRILQLQSADKFRLAGMLLDAGHVQLASAVGNRACQELRLAALLGKE